MFVGTVRDHSSAGEDVTGLTYEAWDELAKERLDEIAAAILERWTVCAVALLHATGTLAVGEASVVVAVSAPHRAEAFEAAGSASSNSSTTSRSGRRKPSTTGDAHWVMGA